MAIRKKFCLWKNIKNPTKKVYGYIYFKQCEQGSVDVVSVLTGQMT